MTDIETARDEIAVRLQLEADHEVALADDAARTKRRHAEYRAYLCMMATYGCECTALNFAAWTLVPR